MKRLLTLAFVIATAALTATAQELSITTESLATATIGQPYTPVALTTTGDPGPISWSFAVGSAPPPGFGVGGSGTTGTFCYGTSNPSGAPTCGGNVTGPAMGYTVVIQARSLSSNQTASATYSFSVQNPLQILTTSLPNASANQVYSAQLQGFGGSGQFVWSIQSGAFPPGIALDPFKGSLSGTAPGVNGFYPFTIQLMDEVTQATVTQLLSITVINGLAILTTSLPNATVNQAYSYQLQGTGQNQLWTIPTGAQFPAGFSLSSSGVITGVGTTLGTFNLPVDLANAQAPTVNAFRLFTLLVTLGPLGIVETILPTATQNAPYSATLTPSGGIPPYTWSLGLSSPQGLSISGNGTLSGTLPTSGSFPILVTLKDSTGASATQNYTLNVSNAVTIATTTLPNGAPGFPYSATLTATGGSVPYQWSVLNGSLPAGLTLEPATGKIIGTPTANATSRFTVQVKDFLGGIASKAFTIIIGPFLEITTSTLPGGALNQPYSPQTLTAINGTPPLTWSIASGTLPAGLQLNSTTGVISGTPVTLGNSTFDVLVTDAPGASAHKTLGITIANPLVITSSDFSGSVLTALTQTLAATGGTPPYTWSSGTLPAGLQLNSTTGVISGTPGEGGTSPVLFTATDANGLTGTKTINITIILPLTPTTSISLGTTTQPAIALTTGAPYPLEITGVLTLAFTSTVGGTDDMVRFSDGSRSLQFIVRANQTQAIFPTTTNAALLTGTVAGTITLTAAMTAGGQNVTPSPAPTKTITIAPAAPVIASVALQQVTGGLSVVVSGYSNTREVSSGSFTFSVSSGNTLSQATITVPLTSAYATWFNNTASNATGGQFKLTVPFSVTQGAASAVTKVTVTLTNSQGASAAVSSQ